MILGPTQHAELEHVTVMYVCKKRESTLDNQSPVSLRMGREVPAISFMWRPAALPCRDVSHSREPASYLQLR